MKKTISSFCLALLAITAHAKSDIVWNDVEKVSKKLVPIEIFTPSSDEMIIHYGSMSLFGKSELRHYKNFTVSATGKVNVTIEKGIGIYEGMELVGNRLFVFVSDTKDKVNSFYAQEYSMKMEAKGKPIKLYEYELEKGVSKYSFSYSISNNQKYVAVHYNVPKSKKVSEPKYGYMVFNSEFKELSSGDFKVPFDVETYEVSQYYLSNSGDFYIMVKEQKAEKNKKGNTFYTTKDLHIMRVYEDRVDQYPLELDNMTIYSTRMSSNDMGIFAVTGAYGETRDGGIEGVYYLTFDSKKKKVINSDYYKFSKEFITAGMNQKRAEKAEKKASKKGEDYDPRLYAFKVRQVDVLADNSTIGVLEQYYTREVQTYNASTKSFTTTTYYHFNDLIAYKVSATGEIAWVERVKKAQVSANDGGLFSSFCSLIGDGEIHFYFNEGLAAYDQNRTYTGGRYNYRTLKKTVFADAALNLETGKSDRTYIGNAGKEGQYAYAKYAYVDKVEGKAYVPAKKGNMMRIGIISL
jgi:hypothetical protein